MPTKTLSGSLKSSSFGDGFGVCPDLTKSLVRIMSRLATVSVAPTGLVTKKYECRNGGHKYVLTARWTDGELKRVGIHKPGSRHHGDAELAYFVVDEAGLGTNLPTHHDNFPSSFGTFGARHRNKLLRRWNLVANATSVAETSGNAW